MIDFIFWWTGVIAWVIVAYFSALLLRDILFAFVVTVDCFVWAYKCCKANGKQPSWIHLPKSFMRKWRDMLDGGESTTYSSTVGEWRGYRDWEVYSEK